MDKIKLNLFDLKSKEDLENVNNFFSKSIKKWFNIDGTPNSKYFHYRNCPLCDEENSNEVYKIDNFSYHKCLSCESIYTKPHLKDGVLESLYSDGTYQFYQDSLVKTGSRIRKGVLEQRKFSQIKEIIKKDSAFLLDVGSGGGTFLDVCNDNGWKVEGVDPSPDASRTSKIKVHHGDFNQINFNKKFDVITFWGVLEHLPDPITTLSKASEILNESGLIIFEVPSSNCFISEYLKKSSFSPTRYIESARHNIFFSNKIIERISINLGMKIELIETNGLDLQTILLENFDVEITDKILRMQDTLNDLLLGDHYRVFLKREG